MILSFRHSGQYANYGKTLQILELAKHYRSYFNICTRKALSQYYQEGKLPKFLPLWDASRLSKRYRQTCGSQVKANLDSWLSNIANRFEKCVRHSTLTETRKRNLTVINKLKAWFVKELAIAGQLLPEEDLKLCRRIFKKVRGKIPYMHKPSMLLDQKVAKVESSLNSSFERWINLSTLQFRKQIKIPLVSYEYYKMQKGEEKHAIQVIVDLKKQQVDFGLIKSVEQETQVAQTEVIGLDLGVLNVVNTSTGNKYGLTLYPLLKKYDGIIQKQLKGRMRRGLKKNSAWLEELHEKVLNLVKNEIGRALNKVIKKEAPSIIVVENLRHLVTNTKKDGRLSKTMRRLLLKSGISRIRDRLAQKCERFNITLVEVNPAYTSQECHSCHEIDKKNRKSKRFKCTNCGLKCDADYNGSVNVKDRRSILSIDLYTPFRLVKEIVRHYYASKDLGFYRKRVLPSSRQNASDRKAVPFSGLAPPDLKTAELLL